MGDYKKEGLMTYQDVQDYVSLNSRTIRRMVDAGNFPRPIHLSRRRLFVAADVKQWLEDAIADAKASDDHHHQAIR